MSRIRISRHVHKEKDGQTSLRSRGFWCMLRAWATISTELPTGGRSSRCESLRSDVSAGQIHQKLPDHPARYMDNSVARTVIAPFGAPIFESRRLSNFPHEEIVCPYTRNDTPAIDPFGTHASRW